MKHLTSFFLAAALGLSLAAQEPPAFSGGENLLNNPELKTSAQTPGHPFDWDAFPADKRESYRYELDEAGNGIVTLLPLVNKARIRNWDEDVVGFSQRYLTLDPGKKYKLGAMIRTKDLKAARAGLIVYNFAWTQAVGIHTLPENTEGWRKLEAEVTLPPTRFGIYSFTLYTVGCTAGEIQIKSPYLIAMDPEAAAGAEKAPVLHSLRRITPVSPLLQDMSAEKPEMLFSFRSVLPKSESAYECRVLLKSGDGSQVLAQEVFPLKDGRIRAEFDRQAPGGVILEAVLTDKETGKVFASGSWRGALRSPVKLSRAPEKRLNMLTQRLLTAGAEDGRLLFSAPRDGWVFITLSKHQENTEVKLDGAADPVIRVIPGRPFETLRYVEAGDHTLELAGTCGGRLLVNAVPEILINGYPRADGNTIEAVLHPEFQERNYYPNVTTIAHGYALNPNQLKDLAARGKRLLNQTMHIGMRRAAECRYETPAEMANRFAVPPAGQGKTFDEIFISEYRAKWVITQALERLTECPAPMYIWSSGVKFDINPLNAAYLSAVANNAGGRGKFIFECYARTQDTGEKADIYLEDYLNESIRRAEQLMPGAAKSSLMVLGMYTNAGNYCTDTYAGPDVKAFWNRIFYKWANEKEFRDLHGIGIYAWHNGNEESLRWAMKLIRHYVIEGNTEDLATKYGYVYLPGHLNNGDFTEGLAHWTASGDVQAVTVKGLGQKYEARRWYPPQTGDTACQFTRSEKTPNTLTAKIVGLTPGRLYVLRYLLVDNGDVKAGKASGEKIVFRAKLEGARDVTASSPVAKYLNPEGLNIRGYVNNVAVVFKAEAQEAVLTFSDWASDTEAGAPAGQEILLNKVSVTPYFDEGM